MGNLEDFVARKKKITDERLLDVKVAKVVNRNKINEVAKKNKLKTNTAASDSSAETDAINMPAAASSVEIRETVSGSLLLDSSSNEKIKLEQKKPVYSIEKKNKRDAASYRNKNHNFWQESDFDQKPKSRPKKDSIPKKKNKVGIGRDASFESTKGKIKSKPGDYSNTEKTGKPKQGTYASNGNTIKPGPGKYSSNVKSNKPKTSRYSGDGKTNKVRSERYSSNEKSNKLRPLKYSSAEKTIQVKPLKHSKSGEKRNKRVPLKYYSAEKTNKPGPGRYSSKENKPRLARGSSYEMWSSPRPNKQPTSVKKTKFRLARDSSSEKLNKPYKYSDEDPDKHKLRSDTSREKKKKRFLQESRERQDFKTASYDKLSRTRPEVYSEVESKLKNSKPDSESSFENHPKPTRIGDEGSPENKLDAGDSTDERNDNKLETSDLSENTKLRQSASSASVEEVRATRKPTTRWKPRNLGREKYLYKRKKVLRSTKMSHLYVDRKLDDKEDTYDTRGTGGDFMNPFIDPYLSPYSCKIDFEQAALQIDGVDTAKVEIVGRSAEYNDIVMLKLSGSKENNVRFRVDARENKYLDEPPEKKIIFIVHGLSVYGMVNVEALSKMRALKTLLGYYGKHLDKFDIYLIPLANPDGFTYSQQVNLWAKNRSPQALCPGVQVDRNFEVAWKNNPHISSCDQHYPGPTPFSEAESRAIRDVLHKHGRRMIAYINVHSSSEDYTIFKGDAVLYPKGYADSNEESDRYLDLQGEIEEMMRNASFRHLSVHVKTLKEWYGKVRGTSVDYASSVYGIPYALEFAMQPYPDNRYITHATKYSKLALEQIWQRVIDVVFNNINNNHQDQVGFKKL